METKVWYCLTCPVCTWRHPLKKFTNTIDPIQYPAQLVSGGGRGSGFHVVKYIPWSNLPRLRSNPRVWSALNSEYLRLSYAYDAFYDTLGYLSPRLTEIVDSLNAEIFRLRSTCRELQDRLDRLLLTTPRGDSNGVGRILEEISTRDQQERRTSLELLK